MKKELLLQKIADNILLERTRKRYTQETLAEKAGISPRYLSKIEAAKVNPSIGVVVNICEALSIGVDVILK